MLVRAETGSLTLTFDGRSIPAREGDSVASALLAAGIQVTRRTPRGGVARGPYCMMGACFECLAEVDGVPNVQTCMMPVRDGMVVTSQDGARTLDVAAPPAGAGRGERVPPAGPGAAQAPRQGAGRDGRVEPGHDDERDGRRPGGEERGGAASGP